MSISNIIMQQSKSNHPNSDLFDQIDNEIKAYWLGFLYADGNVGTSRKCLRPDTLTVKLQHRDSEHLLKLASIFSRKIKPINSKLNGKIYKSVIFQLFSIYLCNALISKGIIPRKTFIDSNVMSHVPDNLLHHFIRGNMDGDGCICRFQNNGKTRYRVDWLGRKKFIESLRKVFVNKFSEENFYSTQVSSISKLSISDTYKIKKVLDWIYTGATIFLERKYAKYLLLNTEFAELTAISPRLKKHQGCRKGVINSWKTRKKLHN
jgi:hypothetical protein